MTDVAILGAGGQIARTIRPHLPPHWRVTAFSRSPGGDVRAYEELTDHAFDLIINAAGPGDPAVHRGAGLELFRITEHFDNLCLDYLLRRPQCAYMFLSTGAVYGNGYAVAGDADSVLSLPVNRLGPEHSYVLAKLAAEAKHRAAPGLRIADLRVFGYASGAMSLDSGFFLAEAARCLVEGRVLVTHDADFRRDIVAPEDLAQLIRVLAESGVPNGAYDACSKAPTTKFALLDRLSRRFGLKVEVQSPEGGTRLPPMDALSTLASATTLGYRPAFTSVEAVEQAVEGILRQA